MGIYTPAVSAPALRAGVERRAFTGVQPPQQPKLASTAAAAMGSVEEHGSTGLTGTGLLGGLTVAVAARAALRRRGSRSQWLTTRRGDEGTPKGVAVKDPKETFEALVDKGFGNSKMANAKVLYASIMGGCYVGLAGLLSLAIAGNVGANPTMSLQKFVFAALFPVNLLLVLQSGAQLFTGNTAVMTMAWLEEKVSFVQMIKSWLISYVGNVIGCGIIAWVAWYTHLLIGGTAELAVATVIKKTSSAFLPTMVKAIGCNWLVCMAVYLCTQANDLTGKMVGIWFPISMFVAIGFEHSVANMFLMPAGLVSGAPLTVMDVITKNLIPVSLGNLIAGAVVIGAGCSLSHGKLGQSSLGSFSGWGRKVVKIVKSILLVESDEDAPEKKKAMA